MSSNPTTYIRINSGAIGLVNQSAAAAAVNFHQPQVEPWRERLEREMLENARRDATRGERSALEEELLRQVSGKSLPAAASSSPVSPQLGAVFQATRPQPSRREIELESQLFEQVSAS